MSSAGVHINTFKPHSTRAAAVSKAKTASVAIKENLDTAGWSSERTFDRFYNKPLQREFCSFDKSELTIEYRTEKFVRSMKLKICALNICVNACKCCLVID